MVKSGKTDIRYHRVDQNKRNFTVDDDSDSELEKELGPSARRRPQKSLTPNSNCYNILRSGCIAFTIIFTLIGLTGVVIYSSNLIPLSSKYFYGSSFITNESSQALSQNSSLFQNEEENSTSTEAPSVGPFTTLSSFEDEDFKTTGEFINHVGDELREKKKVFNRSAVLDDEGFFNPNDYVTNTYEDDQDSNEVEKLATLFSKIDPAYWTDESYEEPLDHVSTQKDFETSEKRRDMFGAQEPEFFEPQRETTSSPHPEPSSTSPDRGSNETTEDVDGAVDGANDVAVDGVSHTAEINAESGVIETHDLNVNEGDLTAPSNLTEHVDGNRNSTTSFYKHQLTVFAKEVWKKYQENNTYVIISIVALAVFVVLLLISCMVCRIKARAAAKQRHFKRLITDLNATEKFSIVTPSEDEDYSE